MHDNVPVALERGKLFGKGITKIALPDSRAELTKNNIFEARAS
jgi:hypothetical protein